MYVEDAYEFGEHYINNIWDCDDDLVFEQYTGIRDKNGEEIYAGYVVKNENSDWQGYIEISPIAGTMVYDVKKDKTGLPLGLYDSVWFGGVYDDSNGIHGKHRCLFTEVIGNIHENPELLTNGRSSIV
jgi:uncharacterized phage protein (TIGR01671 family)